jgi:cell division protein FtsL
MRKQIGKQILSINSSIESYFNKLRLFILSLKKFKFDRNNKVFLGFIAVVFLTLTYFLIPTAYNKKLIQSEIENQIFQKYQIDIKFNNQISYNLFPKPNFSSKGLSILRNEKDIGIVKNFKIFIGFKNFFRINQIQTLDLVLDKSEFNIKKDDLVFFSNLMKIEPNKNKMIIKNSNIFLKIRQMKFYL